MNANWNPDNRRLNVNANDPGNANSNLGVRLSRSFLIASHVFYPAAKHSSDFLQVFLRFEVVFLVDETAIKSQAEKQFQDFCLGAGFQEKRLFEVFRLAVSGCDKLNGFQKRIFQFFPDAILFVFGKSGNRLVSIFVKFIQAFDNRDFNLFKILILFHMDNVYDELISPENLFASWRAYAQGKSKKKDVIEFERHLEDNIFLLCQELRDGNYCHSKYHYFRISDPKKRDIYKSEVRDRIVHHAVYSYLCKVYEPVFIEYSFSSRIGKGSHRAVATLKGLADKIQKSGEKCVAMKCDIKKYFENIDHAILLNILKNKISDQKMLNLLEIIVRSFNAQSGKGIPLGNITSQIFANIYLNELDKFAARYLRPMGYVRYNDDFIILENNRDKLFEKTEKAKIFLKDILKLELPEEKTIFRKFKWGIDFCGCVVLPNAILLRNKTKGRMFENMFTVARKLQHQKISPSDARKIFDSYFGLLSHCNAHNLRMKIRSKYFLV